MKALVLFSGGIDSTTAFGDWQSKSMGKTRSLLFRFPMDKKHDKEN